MATPTTNYSHHRPDDFQWMKQYTEKMGKEALETFLNRVFDRLMKMKIGEIYDLTVKVSDKNRDLFIKIACYYISCGNSEYCFSDDYTTITRHKWENIRTTIDRLAQKKSENKDKKEEPADSNI